MMDRGSQISKYNTMKNPATGRVGLPIILDLGNGVRILYVGPDEIDVRFIQIDGYFNVEYGKYKRGERRKIRKNNFDLELSEDEDLFFLRRLFST